MSEERRAEYRAWLRSHDPDFTQRTIRKQRVDFHALPEHNPPNEEADRIAWAIVDLEAKLAAAIRHAEAEMLAEAIVNQEGIFG